MNKIERIEIGMRLTEVLKQQAPTVFDADEYKLTIGTINCEEKTVVIIFYDFVYMKKNDDNVIAAIDGSAKVMIKKFDIDGNEIKFDIEQIKKKK